MGTIHDDRDLIGRAQLGDPDAVSTLFRQHRGAIERICRRMCSDELEVDDVLQESYVAILRNLPNFRADSAFLTWVYTIVRTHRGRSARAVRRERGRADLLRHMSDVFARPERNVEDSIASIQLCGAIDRAMAKISELDRTVAFLRDVEGLSALEVSDQLGLSVSAVKARLHRARTAIRSRLEPMRPSSASAA